MTKLIWKLHSWFGLVAGLGLVIIGLTGCVLVFTDEIDGMLVGPRMSVQPGTPEATTAKRLPLDTVREKLRAGFPKHAPGGWSLSEKPASPEMVWMTTLPEDGAADAELHWEFIWLDPYTGEALTQPSERSKTLTGWLLELHYAFFLDHTGLFLAGMFGVLLCLLGISGVWLYRGFWKNFFTLRWGRSARIFFSDLHKMVGISSVVFNLILGLTGAWWNLSHLIGHLMEDHAVAEGETAVEKDSASPPERPRHFPHLSLDQLVARTGEALPGFVATYVSLPVDEPGGAITIYGHHADAGPLRSPYGSHVAFHGDTGAPGEVVDIRQAGWGGQVLDSFRPLHYGTFGGLPVKILWAVLALAPGVLALSGTIIWWKRRAAVKSRSRNRVPGSASVSQPASAAG